MFRKKDLKALLPLRIGCEGAHCNRRLDLGVSSHSFKLDLEELLRVAQAGSKEHEGDQNPTTEKC